MSFHGWERPGSYIRESVRGFPRNLPGISRHDIPGIPQEFTGKFPGECPGRFPVNRLGRITCEFLCKLHCECSGMHFLCNWRECPPIPGIVRGISQQFQGFPGNISGNVRGCAGGELPGIPGEISGNPRGSSREFPGRSSSRCHRRSLESAARRPVRIGRE